MLLEMKKGGSCYISSVIVHSMFVVKGLPASFVVTFVVLLMLPSGLKMVRLHMKVWCGCN